MHHIRLSKIFQNNFICDICDILNSAKIMNNVNAALSEQRYGKTTGLGQTLPTTGRQFREIFELKELPF